MNDPHVVSLEYELESPPQVVYDKPEPVERETASFDLRLSDGVLTANMKEHHATETEARAAVDAFLCSWEISLGLEHGLLRPRFRFRRSNVKDRNPPPPGSPVFVVSSASISMDGQYAVLKRTWRKYPEPPERFAVTPDVETLWNRYHQYLEEREPLAGMAYACLTFVTKVVTKSKKDARSSASESRSSTRSEGSLHRRVDASIRRRDRTRLTRENGFLLRFGCSSGVSETAGVTALPQITMADLPHV